LQRLKLVVARRFTLNGLYSHFGTDLVLTTDLVSKNADLFDLDFDSVAL